MKVTYFYLLNIYSMSGKRLGRDFYMRDVLDVAPDIVGKYLVVSAPDGGCRKFRVTEVEAYRGEEDKACHASRGRTGRTEIMYHEGGRLYVYFVYGMYWMLNVVTGSVNDPQAVLIRGVETLPGPGRLTKALGIDRSFYGEDLTISERIWLEDHGAVTGIKTGRRIGIDYAGDYWKEQPWRYFI
jgi:DNA-3-methyladenine glycosylase